MQSWKMLLNDSQDASFHLRSPYFLTGVGSSAEQRGGGLLPRLDTRYSLLRYAATGSGRVVWKTNTPLNRPCAYNGWEGEREMAMKERTQHPAPTAKALSYSPEMTDAEIAALIARLHRNAAARTHPGPQITDSVEV